MQIIIHIIIYGDIIFSINRGTKVGFKLNK